VYGWPLRGGAVKAVDHHGPDPDAQMGRSVGSRATRSDEAVLIAAGIEDEVQGPGIGHAGTVAPDRPRERPRRRQFAENERAGTLAGTLAGTRPGKVLRMTGCYPQPGLTHFIPCAVIAMPSRMAVQEVRR
jgi:hypothetical protein